MRQAFIAGNWKMHKNIAEARALAGDLSRQLATCPHRLMVAPPFTALAATAETLAGSSIQLGAQNMAPVESGAHTGEISVGMLRDVGVQVVIIGHSERRHIYHETNEAINAKLRLALAYGLDAILCVGELISEREAGQAETVVREQLEQGLAGVDEKELRQLVVAYEPVWAIGTGKTATPQDADTMHHAIRRYIEQRYSATAAGALCIQYGGSVKPGNIGELMRCEHVDGALVGGASLTSADFISIARYDQKI